MLQASAVVAAAAQHFCGATWAKNAQSVLRVSTSKKLAEPPMLLRCGSTCHEARRGSIMRSRTHLQLTALARNTQFIFMLCLEAAKLKRLALSTCV
eukprot:12768-Heterococcus_DN1.PRE.3